VFILSESSDGDVRQVAFALALRRLYTVHDRPACPGLRRLVSFDPCAMQSSNLTLKENRTSESTYARDKISHGVIARRHPRITKAWTPPHGDQ
jgi:hypothetical protein